MGKGEYIDHVDNYQVRYEDHGMFLRKLNIFAFNSFNDNRK